ncbi:MAG TPA: hypothetical protein DDZ80_18005 [Cyanobacteria bacterium UBA8803]|nr:hypothetical protein [Cyanobacteria bacterium UBA9273]HBL60280.1 hypothetical protein [Cyanobacteria bacterium UBA8803]
MRFSSLAVCTLTAFVAGGLTAQAVERQNPEGSVVITVTAEPPIIPSTVTSQASESGSKMAALEEQLFLENSAVGSRQNNSSESASSPGNSQKLALEEQLFLQNVARDSRPNKPSGLASSAGEIQALEEAQVNNPVKTFPQINSAAISQPETIQAEHTQKELFTTDTPLTQSQVSLLDKRNQTEVMRQTPLPSQSSTANAHQLVAQTQPQTNITCALPRAENSESAGDSASFQVAQGGGVRRCPRPQPITPLVVPEPFEEFGASPALSIYIPVGYGADRNTVFLNGNYQATVREDEGSVGAAALGIGVGNADKAVGLELSYALETTDDEFGEGGFNAKLHRRFGQDVSAALGWNGFLNIGRNDFEQSKYGVITKVFRTQDSLDKFFSRVAFTVGVGDGQFRSNGAVDDGDNNINVFGNVAIRVARPISFITEWTGQDLALGLSIAPFKNFPLVITPAVRDLAGAGDGARFVIGAGTAFRF